VISVAKAQTLQEFQRQLLFSRKLQKREAVWV
jgi:hypothetical protein